MAVAAVALARRVTTTHPTTVCAVNPRQRILTTLRGDRTDRVPLVLPGVTFQDAEEIARLTDPHRRELAERVFDETVYRVPVDSHVNRMLVTPPQRISRERTDLPNGDHRTRGTIDTPKGELTFATRHSRESSTTWQVKYPVETLADIEKIASIPWELPRGLRPASRRDLPGDFDRRGLLVCSISSPMVCVAGMMPYQMFLELCVTEPALIAELTETCLRRILDCLDVLTGGGAVEYVWIGGSEWLTPPMGSPALYDTLVQDPERRLIDRIRERTDAIVHIHCHGRVRRAIEKMIERGADYTEPVEPPDDGDVTMAEAKRIAAGRITLGGNVECRVLAHESVSAVEAATRAAFEGGTDRFILRPTEGPSPRISRRERDNYLRMLDVWEELSPIG